MSSKFCDVCVVGVISLMISSLGHFNCDVMGIAQVLPLYLGCDVICIMCTCRNIAQYLPWCVYNIMYTLPVFDSHKTFLDWCTLNTHVHMYIHIYTLAIELHAKYCAILHLMYTHIYSLPMFFIRYKILVKFNLIRLCNYKLVCIAGSCSSEL